jgi:hypothetical protein
VIGYEGFGHGWARIFTDEGEGIVRRIAQIIFNREWTLMNANKNSCGKSEWRGLGARFIPHNSSFILFFDPFRILSKRVPS